jgi:hypothetical protein
VTLPLPTVEPVAVTEQLPDDSVHDEEENVTVPVPGVPCVKLTDPVGLEPVTVAVQVLPEPTATLDGVQFTVVVLGVMAGPPGSVI